MKALSINAMFFTALTMVSCLSFAQADNHPGHRKGGGHFKAMQQLDLTPEQLELLDSLLGNNKEQRQAQRALRHSLQTLIQSDDYSYAAAETIARQLAELQYQQLLAKAEAQRTFYQSLTEEQKEKAATLRTQKMRRHQQQ